MGSRERLKRTLCWVAVIFAAVYSGLAYLWYLFASAEEGSISSEIKYSYIPYHYAVYGQIPRDLSKFQEFVILEDQYALKFDVYKPELRGVSFDGNWCRGTIEFHAWPARRIPFSVAIYVIRSNAEHYAKKYGHVKKGPRRR